MFFRNSPGTSGNKLRHWPDIARLRTDQPSGRLLFARMRDPAGDAPGGEDIAEGLRRKTRRFQHQRGVELDIGLQRALWLGDAKHLERRLLDLLGESQPLAGLALAAGFSSASVCSERRRSQRLVATNAWS